MFFFFQLNIKIFERDIILSRVCVWGLSLFEKDSRQREFFFFGKRLIVLSSHDSHLAPEMGETHDELLEVDFSIAVIVKDVDDSPEIARYTASTFLSKFVAFQTGTFWAAFLCLEVLQGNGQTFRATLLGRGIWGGRKKNMNKFKK